MTMDVTTPHTRRSVLMGSLAALGALVLGGLARPGRVSAHDPDDIQLGGPTIQDEPGPTIIRNQSSNGVALEVEDDHGPFALTASEHGTGGGFQGFSYHGTGIEGFANAKGQTGVRGRANGGTGVVGFSGIASDTAPAAQARTGVLGIAGHDAAAIGVMGQSSSGRGGVFKGKLAQLRLPPSSAASHPHAGQPGDLFVDSSYRLWFCKGGAAWVQIA